MSIDLRALLSDLADDGPSLDVLAREPARAWVAGRRTRRRSILALVTVLIVLVGAGTLLVTGLTRGSTAPVPAGPSPHVSPGGQGSALPRRIVNQHAGLTTTAEAGPIGPLSVIGTGPAALVDDADLGISTTGVSAVTGVQRVISLPDQAPDPALNQGSIPSGPSIPYVAPTLSPDGHYIAYFTPAARPRALAEDGGVNIYDTVTGQVVRQVGLDTDGLTPHSLTWSGDSEHVLVMAALDRGTDGGQQELSLIVSVGAPGPQTLNPPLNSRGNGVGPGPDVEVLVDTASGVALRTVDTADGQVTTAPLTTELAAGGFNAQQSIAVSPDGNTAAFASAPLTGVEVPQIYTAPTRAGITFSDVHPIPGSRTYFDALQGFLPDGRLIIVTVTAHGDMAVQAVNAATGQRDTLSLIDIQPWWQAGVSIAVGLADAQQLPRPPTYDRPHNSQAYGSQLRLHASQRMSNPAVIIPSVVLALALLAAGWLGWRYLRFRRRVVRERGR